jgi:hypothetical protein
MVVSGDHHAGYETICDVIAERIRGQRAIIRGASHLVQDTGAPFNDQLETFLRDGD